VAVKIQTNDRAGKEAFQTEVAILHYLDLNDTTGTIKSKCVRLLDDFIFRQHPCLVFELLGISLLQVMY